MFCKNILIKRKKTLVTKCHHSKLVTSKNSIIFHKNCNIRQEIDFAVNLLLNLKPQYFVPREGFKKSCNNVTTYIGGWTGNYTKSIYFFHGPKSSKYAKKFFCWWRWDLTSARYLHIIFEATP